MLQNFEIFKKLAADVSREWFAAGENAQQFPAIATRLLEEFPYTLGQEQFDQAIASWLRNSEAIPEQMNVHNTFGEPPLTIFNNGKFVVDIYIWRGCDTSIHSHGFRGAFRVLHGQSLHETFHVKVVETVAHDVELTELGFPDVELLEAGAVRTIAAGKELTHRVIHLADPTVSLCVKTINEKVLSQWHHFDGGLAIQKRHLDPALLKKIYFFQYLASRDGLSAENFLDEVLAKQDISILMNLCEELSTGGYAIDEGLIQVILEEVYRRYEGTEWFRRYENATAGPETNISFAEFTSPRARLVAHFMNQGLRLSSVRKMLPTHAAHLEKELKAELAPFFDANQIAAFLGN